MLMNMKPEIAEDIMDFLKLDREQNKSVHEGLMAINAGNPFALLAFRKMLPRIFPNDPITAMKNYIVEPRESIVLYDHFQGSEGAKMLRMMHFFDDRAAGKMPFEPKSNAPYPSLYDLFQSGRVAEAYREVIAFDASHHGGGTVTPDGNTLYDFDLATRNIIAHHNRVAAGTSLVKPEPLPISSSPPQPR